MAISNRKKSILRKNPYKNRRSFVARAMGLSPIGDIANPTLSEVTAETLTWETASDWDSAADEYGVVHENTANTDHSDASVITKGYSAASPFKSPYGYWPMHEDSGSTAYDFGSGGNDGTHGSGVTSVGDTAPIGTTCYTFSGVEGDVGVNLGSIGSSWSSLTHIMWFYDTDGGNFSDYRYLFGMWDGSDRPTELEANSGTNAFRWHISGSTINTSGFVSDNTWTAFMASWDGSNVNFYKWEDGDGSSTSSVGSGSASGSLNLPDTIHIGSRPNGQAAWQGKLWEGYMLGGTALTQSDFEDYVGVVRDESYLESATKSFSTAGKPDLQNLSYSLNGGSITLDVIGSPSGTPETISQTLDGSTSYTLSWSNSHTDFRIKPRITVSSITNTPPTFGKAELAT